MFDDLSWVHGLIILPLGGFAWWMLQLWMTKKDDTMKELAVATDDLKARLIGIEARLPNGELSTIMYRMGEIDKKLVTVLEHVDEHNKEAEEWKRRIMLLEGKVE